MGFAERLAALRTRAGLSQRGLADLAGLKSARHVGLLEAAEELGPKVAAKTLASLAAVFGCSVDHLMFGTEPGPTDEEIGAAVASARARLAADGEEAKAS